MIWVWFFIAFIGDAMNLLFSGSFSYGESVNFIGTFVEFKFLNSIFYVDNSFNYGR